jgi:hypothetical protein
MVVAFRRGASRRAVGRRFRVGVATVHLWVQRAAQQRLDRVEWTDRPSLRHRTSRTEALLEDRVLTLRSDLLRTSDWGHFGARAIHHAWREQSWEPIPSVRTIGRILERRGALDYRYRVRRPPPPAGWYLPEVATRRAELDSFDIIEGLVIQGGPFVEVLNGISLHGGLAVSYPRPCITAKIAAEMILAGAPPQGRLIYFRRTNDQGYLTFLGHTFSVDPQWPNRLARAEVNFDKETIAFYALRRRAPHAQPLLNRAAYRLPHRGFIE